MESPYGMGLMKLPVSDREISPMPSPNGGGINQEDFMKTLTLGKD